jgi:protein-disulfide isomerase
MFYRVLAASIVCSQALFAIEYLSDDYCIIYSDKQSQGSKRSVVEYFSFSCPNCASLFREEFEEVKKEFINGNQSSAIQWKFHPIPLDFTTIQAMTCLGKLTNNQKQVFLEAILSDPDYLDPEIAPRAMQKAMDYFGVNHTVPLTIQDLEGDPLLEQAFAYIQKNDLIKAVPTIECDGKVYSEFPDLEFLRVLLTKGVSNAKF